MANELDKTKERLNIGEMDSGDKKELFDKFKKGGGQVVDYDKDIKKLQSINRPPKKATSGATVAPEETSIKKTSSKTSSKSGSKKASKEANNSEYYFKYIFSRIGCFLSNLISMSGKRLSRKFMNLSLERAYSRAIYIKTCLDAVFSSDKSKVIKFRDHILEEGFTEDYEYAYYLHSIIDKHLLFIKQNLSDLIDESEEYTLTIFKKMTSLQSFYRDLQQGSLKIVNEYARFFNEKVYAEYSPQKFSQSVNFLWVEWYMWLEELVNFYWIRYCYKQKVVNKSVFLQDENDVIIGALTQNWEKDKIERETEQEKQELIIEGGEEEQILQEYPDANIATGALLIIDNVDFDSYIKECQESKDSRVLFEPDDKMLYTHILIDYFDKEFSLVWNKINFYVDLGTSGGRFDPKKEIKAILSRLTQFEDMVSEYLKSVRDLKKNVHNPSNTPAELTRQLSRTSVNSRQTLLSTMENFVGILSKVFACKGQHNDSVGNWEEVLFTQKNYENKLLYECTVEQILTKAYGFSSVMVWLLKYKDLSGLSYKLDNDLKVINSEFL